MNLYNIYQYKMKKMMKLVEQQKKLTKNQIYERRKILRKQLKEEGGDNKTKEKSRIIHIN